MQFRVFFLIKVIFRQKSVHGLHGGESGEALPVAE